MYEVVLTIGFRLAALGPGGAVTTLPSGRPIGLPGRHNRPQSLHGLLTDLPPGVYEVGVAGVGRPAVGGELVTVNHIRMTVLVLEP